MSSHRRLPEIRNYAAAAHRRCASRYRRRPRNALDPALVREAEGADTRGPRHPRLADKLLEDRRFKNLAVDHEELGRLVTSDKSLPYLRFVAALIDLHGRAKGKRASRCVRRTDSGTSRLRKHYPTRYLPGGASRGRVPPAAPARSGCRKCSSASPSRREVARKCPRAGAVYGPTRLAAS
jgi:hypothetical protein